MDTADLGLGSAGAGVELGVQGAGWGIGKGVELGVHRRGRG